MTGELKYLKEKLGEAIRAGMLTEDPNDLVQVFSALNRGLSDVKSKGRIAALEDEGAQKWIQQIKDLITPSEDDGKDPRAAQVGSYYLRAARMTRDEKQSLGTCITELRAHVDNYDGD